MATNEQAQQLGFATPAGTDKWRLGDDVIAQNARAATERLLLHAGILTDHTDQLDNVPDDVGGQLGAHDTRLDAVEADVSDFQLLQQVIADGMAVDPAAPTVLVVGSTPTVQPDPADPDVLTVTL